MSGKWDSGKTFAELSDVSPGGRTDVAIRYVETAALGGSDANDGFSPYSPHLTLGHAMSDVLSAQGYGHIYVGPGNFNISTTQTIRQTTHIHGSGPQGAASGGTDFTWTGADDGSSMFITANGTGNDWSYGVLEGFQIKGAAGMTGHGTALSVRNPQNLAYLNRINVTGWHTGAAFRFFEDYSPEGPSGTNYPGFTKCEQLWAFCGEYPFKIEAGYTDLSFYDCGVDTQTETIAAYWLDDKPVGATISVTATESGTDATFTTGSVHGLSGGEIIGITGMSVGGYNGRWKVGTVTNTTVFHATLTSSGLGAGSGGTFQRYGRGSDADIAFYSCKCEVHPGGTHQDAWVMNGTAGVTLVGCSAKDGAAGTKTAYLWNGYKYNAGNTPDYSSTNIPLAIINSQCQGFDKWFAAPNISGLSSIDADQTGGVVYRGTKFFNSV